MENKDKKPFNWDRLICGLAIVFFASVLFYECHKDVPTVVSTSNDVINVKEQKLLAQVAELKKSTRLDSLSYDSLKKSKTKWFPVYETRYDSIYVSADSLCKTKLEVVHADQKRKDSINDGLNKLAWNMVTKQAKTIFKFDSIHDINKERRFNDSIKKRELRDSIKISGKKGFCRGFKWGFGTGAAATQIGNSATKYYLK